MRIVRKYVDKFYDGRKDIATAFTLIFSVLGMGLVLCLVGICICIFGGGE